MLKAQINSVIMSATGQMPGNVETAPAPASDGGEGPAPTGGPGPGEMGAPSLVNAAPTEVQQLMTELVTKAYGTQLPQRRIPNSD